MYLKLDYFVLLIICILFLYVQEVFTIKCWDCRSDIDPKCADPFDNKTALITDCREKFSLPHLPGLKPQLCRKTRQKVHGQWRYFRGCAYLGEPGIHGDERFCLMRTGTYNIFVEHCTCNSKDGCNTGSLLSLIKPIHMLWITGFILLLACSKSCLIL